MTDFFKMKIEDTLEILKAMAGSRSCSVEYDERETRT